MTHISYKQFFATLSGDSRLEILEYLKLRGEQSVSQITQGTGQEQSAVSHNLKKLLACNCVTMTVKGKNRCYSLNKETVMPLFQLADRHIENYCTSECSACSTKSHSSNLVPGKFEPKKEGV